MLSIRENKRFNVLFIDYYLNWLLDLIKWMSYLCTQFSLCEIWLALRWSDDFPGLLEVYWFWMLIFVSNCFLLFHREMGIDTVVKCENGQQEMLRLAQTMFDTKLPPGVVMLQPFSEESSIKKITVQVCFRLWSSITIKCASLCGQFH